MNEIEEQRRVRREERIIAALAACASLVAFLYYFQRGEILLYGDAVAHINIARRVFDSREPGLAQLGTVWLPFPHLLQIPFLWIAPLWKSGVGGSIPSMIAYIVGTLGIYRLLRARTTDYTAWVGAGVYAANPSLLYMQSTAMTESVFLAAMIWSVFYADEFRRGLFPPEFGDGLSSRIPAWRALERCGLCLGAAIMTRYDGWVFAALVGVVNLVTFIRWAKADRDRVELRRVRRSVAAFLLFCALMPVLWLAHNYYLSRHPLDWFNGPYSAKAIETRTTKPGDPPYPGKNSMKVASQYFLKVGVMNMSEGKTAAWIFALAVFGTFISAAHIGRYGSLLLLWIPLPFYAYSVAYGSVPIFLPVWWPYSYYNVRYGLELLPLFSVMIAMAAMATSGLRVKRIGAVLSAVVVLVAAYAYWSSWRGDSQFERGVRAPWPGPICYREALVNGRSRLITEHWLATQFRQLPPDARILMGTSEYVGALQQAGIPLHHVVSESTFLVWEAAQSAPAAVADYVVAIGNDPVAAAVKTNSRALTIVAEKQKGDGPAVTLYRSSIARGYSGLKR